MTVLYVKNESTEHLFISVFGKTVVESKAKIRGKNRSFHVRYTYTISVQILCTPAPTSLNPRGL